MFEKNERPTKMPKTNPFSQEDPTKKKEKKNLRREAHDITLPYLTKIKD